MKNELIEKLSAKITEDDLISNIREVNQLKVDFDDWLLKSEGKQQVDVLKAKDIGKEIEQIDFSVFKEQFYNLYDCEGLYISVYEDDPINKIEKVI